MFCPNPDCPHRLETGNSAEFRDEILRCSDCGTPLVAEDPAPEQREHARRHVELVEVAELSDPTFAALARTLLDEAGIHYEIEGERVGDFFALSPGLQTLTGAPYLRVEAERLEEAQAILEAIEAGAAEAAQSDKSDLEP